MGACNYCPSRLNQTVRPFRCLHRPMLRGRIHRRRLFLAPNRRDEPLQGLYPITSLLRRDNIRLCWTTSRSTVRRRPQEELQHVVRILGLWYNQYHYFLRHLHSGALPTSPASRSVRQGGQEVQA